MLANVAQQVLAQPAAASAAERNWSIYGQIHSLNRARMSHRTADKLVYCHETMHLQERMQSAGWSPDVVKWESDEDSDSDDDDWIGDEREGCPSEEVIAKLIT